ncbi:endonuclease-8 [Marisediminitalea aggregata]|uniref:DNA-(apurinic or apyrimidinic site) lyase n=1 Tax=Marisediminitalea aggregata TaxID=634436 RepID=A0A1M5MEL0_9ALTE|nr:endonuclease VIII [Marisediminitalea aggregata]SHG75587.1 endonuclease-8 [Marisediminitalea aggregata]
MPEGPEIRRSRDKLAQVLIDAPVTHVDAGHSAIQSHRQAFTGSTVINVESRGKAMLIHFDIGLSVYSHNQLYGLWYVRKNGEYPNTNRQLRFGLHTAKGAALLYSASDISVWPTAEIQSHPFLVKLGPDVLNDCPSVEEITERLMMTRFQGRKLASLYLDQAFLAGIGNYLRSEILFFAGVHPDLRPKDLTAEQLKALACVSIEVTQRAYKTAGYTVPDAFFRYAKNHKLPYEASRFMAFNRDTQPCRVCETPIVRMERGNRRIYVCKQCQPGG